VTINAICKIVCLSVSCQMNNVYGRPGPNSIWTTTALGDVYVFDPAIAEVKNAIFDELLIYLSITKEFVLRHSFQECQLSENGYVQEMDVAGKDTPFESILQNGFGYGSTLKISVCIHDDADR